MAGALNLLAPLVGAMTGELGERVARAKQRAILYVVAAGMIGIALVFLLAALAIYLSGLIGPLLAALVIGGGFLLIGALVLAGASISKHNAKERKTTSSRSVETTALVAATAVAALPALARSGLLVRVGVPALAALAALTVLSREKE